ncbi:LptF/LptG family permease [Elusimicrobiota bacterium]
MKIIYRYLFREFIKPLFFSCVVFGGLVMLSEFFRNLNFYLEQKTPFFEVGLYLFLNLPWWTIQVLPVSVLLAVLFSLGQLARHREITAFKAAGINLWRIISIFMVFGALIAVADLSLREFVIPHTSRLADKVLREKIHKEKPRDRAEFRDVVVSVPNNGRMTVGLLNTKNNYMHKIVIDYFNDNFDLTDQIVAESARFENNIWILTNCVERTFVADNWSENHFQERQIELDVKPNDLVLDDIRPEQKTIKYYRNYIKQLKNLGIPSEKEKLRFYIRFASAFSSIIVMIIGIPFAIEVSGRHGKILSFTFALIFAFIYWGIQAVGQSLGENKIISPLFAAWLSNIIFGITGLVLINRIRK